MNLFVQELKKVWRPGIVAALVVSTLAFWFLVGRGPAICNFPNGNQATFEFELAREWAEAFGAAIDDSEMPAVREAARAAEDAFESDLSAFEGAVERGLQTREDFDEFWRGVLEREYEVQQAGGVIDGALETDIALQEQIAALPSYERASEIDLMRSALEEEEGPRGFVSHMWMQDIETYFTRLSTWLAIAPVFVMAPAAARDRLHRMQAAQWSSYAGRKVFAVQLAAAIPSAALVLIVSVLAWMVPLVGTGLGDLMGCAIAGPMSGYACWWDMTLGVYLAARIALMVVLGFATGLLSSVLAWMSAGYVGMLLRIVPVCAGFGWLLAPALFDHALCVRAVPGSANPFSTGWLPTGGEAMITVAIMVAVIAICAIYARWQRRCDLR